MKNSKTSSLLRLVAFLLITVVLIGAVGLVSEGMTKEPSTDKPSDTTSDETTNAPPVDDIPVNTTPTVPTNLHYLSGLSSTKDACESLPLAYVVDPSMPLYGIKDAPLSIEFALEEGESRLLVFTTNTKELGKIGSVCPSRKYINSLVSHFGGILVHNGEDDTVEYTSKWQPSSQIDLGKSGSYSYSEGTNHLYTNGQLMSSALDNSRLLTKFSSFPTLPYSFVGYFDIKITGDIRAQNIQIPFGTQNRISLNYDSAMGKYVIAQNGINRVDLHSGDNIAYDNAFILFCDATTYERSDTTELVLDTESGGSGYYFTGGTMIKMLWSCDESGNMLFYDVRGEKLCINRGNTYISYFKTTLKNTISFS